MKSSQKVTKIVEFRPCSTHLYRSVSSRADNLTILECRHCQKNTIMISHSSNAFISVRIPYFDGKVGWTTDNSCIPINGHCTYSIGMAWNNERKEGNVKWRLTNINECRIVCRRKGMLHHLRVEGCEVRRLSVAAAAAPRPWRWRSFYLDALCVDMVSQLGRCLPPSYSGEPIT